MKEIYLFIGTATGPPKDPPHNDFENGSFGTLENIFEEGRCDSDCNEGKLGGWENAQEAHQRMYNPYLN